MRIFKDFVEADQEVKREIHHNGLLYQTQTWQDKKTAADEGFLTKELLGYTFTVRNPNIASYIAFKGLNNDWIEADFAERIGGKALNPGEAWKLRRETWEQFLEPDGKFGYTYSERIGAQPQEVINLLKEVPTSRHGLILIYDPTIDGQRRNSNHRVPCSIYYQAFIREGELVMIYNIRSNDYNTHFPYDLILARKMQEYIAKEVDKPAGDFIYQSGSLHAFKRDNSEIF